MSTDLEIRSSTMDSEFPIPAGYLLNPGPNQANVAYYAVQFRGYTNNTTDNPAMGTELKATTQF